MERTRRIATVAARWLLGLALVLILSLVFLLYTGAGNAALASLIGWLSGGTVAIAGLSGSLPDAPRAKTVEIRDANGVWLRIEDLSLDWDALAVIGNRIDIRAVTAAKIAVLRKPIQDEEESEGTAPRIDIAALRAPRIEIAKAVAGHAAVLSASGALHYVSRHQVEAGMAIVQIDGAGRYRVDGGIANDIAHGSVSIKEDSKGILGAVLGLPGLGAINLGARASGDSHANRIAFDLAAGDLKAQGSGTIALATRRADIDFVADAPRMSPSPDIKWQLLVLEGHMHGAFDAPRLDGKLTVSDAAISGLSTTQIVAQLSGGSGVVDLSGTATGLRIPGAHPDLFAQAPIAASAHVDLKAAARPVTFKLRHPLLALDGGADTRGTTKLTLTAAVPALAPFAKLAGEDLRGTASLKIDAGQDGPLTQFQATGRIDAQGASVLARVLGRGATFSLGAVLNGADIERSDAAIMGAAVDFRSHGTLRARHLDYGVEVKLLDVSRLSNALIGNATLSGRILGPLGTATTTITGSATIASKGFAPRRVDLSAQAKGFPGISSSRLRASGSLNGAPLSLRGDFVRQDNGATAASASAKWKSLDATGEFTMPPKGQAGGKARLAVAQLADLAPLVAMKMTGSLTALLALDTRGRVQTASIHAQASRIAVSGAVLGAASADGTVADPFGTPSLALDVAARQIAVSSHSGDAQARLTGPLRALAISAKASFDDVQAEGDARLDAQKKKLTLNALTARWRGETATLAAPATLDYAGGLAVDRLRAALGGGELALSGRLMPNLAATASLRSIDAKLLQPFVSTPLAGRLSGDAQLSGSFEEPRGTLNLHARELVLAQYFPRTPIDIDLQSALHGKTMTVDAKVTAGPAVLAVTGEAPLRAGEAMRLHARGSADLAMLNPFVAAEGRRLSGALSLDADIAGTAAAPRITGSGAVKNGEIRDYARGVHLNAIDAAFTAEGQALHITRLSARAGQGTIAGSGMLDLAGPGIPLDVTLQIRNARPIVSDLMTATLSGDLHVLGSVKKTITVSGKLDVSRGTINVPDRFPPEVAVLDVRRKGAAQPEPQRGGGAVVLDIAVETSGPIFVRGRGIDADMGGDLHIGGTTAAPFATGGFTMNRGTVTLAGQTLTFTSGKLGFDGAGIKNRIDPALDLAAQTSSGGVTATLAVTGHASAPKIVLSSTPSLPQDEVLARLFFQQSAKQLTPLQLAQIAQAIASLGGIGTGFDPLGALRRGLSLDRLSVGSSTGGASGSESETTVEGGKYVARNIYVGAKQSLSGTAQVQVQIDLTKQLKAQATVGTGTNATATKGSAAQDNGSSVGLSYEFEY